MKVLIYSQFCTPEPIFKSVPFARELLNAGHEVRVLTGFPNYPGGKLYSGYRVRPWSKESIDGVPILRVPLFPSHGGSLSGRMANYLTFSGASLVPVLLGWRPDVVYVYNLVTLGAVARLGRWIRGVPYVMDVQDLWPDSVVESGMGRSWMRTGMEKLCGWAYRGAARVVGLSPGMAGEMVRRGVPGGRVRWIYNWCDENALPRGEDAPTGAVPEFEGRFTVLYAGNLGTVQALETVIQAAAITARRNPKIQFAFMGKGVMERQLRERAQALAPGSTVFLPARPLSEAFAVMRRADVLLMHLQRKPLFEITIPSKTQAYLALGKPIIAAVGRDAAELVRKAAAGVECTPEDPQAMAEAALQLADLGQDKLAGMGRSGRAFYFDELCLAKGARRWVELFEEIVPARS